MNTPRPMRCLAAVLSTTLLACVFAQTAWAADGSLQLLPQPDLLVGLLVFFLLLVVPVNALLFRPLLRVLDERADRIEGTRSRAERLDAESVELKSRLEDALREARETSDRNRRDRIEEARADFQARTGAARSEAEQLIEASRVELATSLSRARSQLSEQAQELAQEAAACVLGRSL